MNRPPPDRSGADAAAGQCPNCELLQRRVQHLEERLATLEEQLPRGRPQGARAEYPDPVGGVSGSARRPALITGGGESIQDPDEPPRLQEMPLGERIHALLFMMRVETMLVLPWLLVVLLAAAFAGLVLWKSANAPG